MRFLSVCSGIEAASVAWRPLGWTAVAFSEVEPFPCAVLAHYHPETPNWGDMTKFRDWPDATIDVLVGGTPCQSFSVAGLRKGLADPRGNLALVYLGILDRYRPRWMVWENVPGVLSSNKGRDFGAFLGGLAELGYGFAYRVLDAQYFGLAQRRKRVFVVGHVGDWRRAAAVLFEPESLSGHPAPRREAGQTIAPTLAARTRSGGGLGTDAELNGPLVAFGGNNTSGPIDTAAALNAKGGAGRMDFESETLVLSGDDLPLAHSLRGGGFDASEDGTGRGTPLVPVITGTLDCAGDRGGTVQDAYGGRLLPICGETEFLPQSSRVYMPDGLAPALQATGSRMGNRSPQVLAPIPFDETQITSATNRCNPQPGDPCHPLAAGARAPTLAFHARQDPDSGPVTHPLDTDGSSIGVMTCADAEWASEAQPKWRVRRLTPTECERLQGFPDGYTLIRMPRAVRKAVEADFAAYLARQYAAADAGAPSAADIARLAADGPRYKALGNSMAVPVMRWIGEGIAAVDAIPKHGEAA